mmetsp:Transcript_50359/g.129708  ORF Transcript_50359/g.129708 Transcript_50359/m.129708 type:complete len:535 (-) Transcript_50359:386-1990(-)
MASKHEILSKHVEMMRFDTGYDIVIVCTSNESQEEYWQSRLEHGKGQIIPKNAAIVAVHEDWEGGAGNGLGTLYAFEKAAKKHQELTGKDIIEEMETGASVALFHTAGKGTRLAPLPGSENNNKPGVKLPASLIVKGVSSPLTILEAVIKQTGIYAPSRKGRLSVYWGDQVFVPSTSPTYTPSHHADILCSLGPMPSAEDWEKKSLDKYGLIFENAEKNCAQLEKVSHGTAVRMLAQWGKAERVGTSLGSFSVSVDLVRAFLSEFKAELNAKKGKLDTDPHFWMPMTLSEPSYCELMETKGVAQDVSKAHWERMQVFLKKFEGEQKVKMPLFGAVDIGTDLYWWDYGRLSVYYDNNMMITQEGEEANAMRTFLNVKRGEQANMGRAQVDGSSICLDSDVSSGRAVSSILNNVHVGELDVENSILINVTAKKLKARNAILYNVVEEGEDGIDIEVGGVMADVTLPLVEDNEKNDGKVIRLLSNLDICGGKKWSERLADNDHSFEDVHAINKTTDIKAAENHSSERHNNLRELLNN